jgi:nifR3 family TIM-barrel protein
MAEAARIVVDRGAPIIDINMGCWVPKVVKKGGGAALLSDTCRARAVVEAVVKAVPVPVTVKVRSGLNPRQLTAVPFARIAQEAGVAAIAVHARTAEQGFTGEADWDIIAQVVQAVSIPVIGNGDINSSADIDRMRAQTGCQGVMIGRAALGAPWCFSGDSEPPLPYRAAVALRHLELTRECTSLPEVAAVRELRGQLSRYRLDLPGETSVRDRLVRLESYREALELLAGLANAPIRELQACERSASGR